MCRAGASTNTKVCVGMATVSTRVEVIMIKGEMYDPKPAERVSRKVPLIVCRSVRNKQVKKLASYETNFTARRSEIQMRGGKQENGKCIAEYCFLRDYTFGNYLTVDIWDFLSLQRCWAPSSLLPTLPPILCTRRRQLTLSFTSNASTSEIRKF